MKKNKKNKPLGIGLEALIPNYQTEDSDGSYIDHVEINLISPNSNQPRQIFSDKNMQDLVNSIDENGILQPLTVRLSGKNSYELIAGERRLRAAKKLNLKKVPVYIIDVKKDDDMLKLALIENIQRDNLSSIEEAEGYALLRGKYSISETELAKMIGKNRSTIANKLRLNKLPPDIKNVLRSKDPDFREGHARALLSLRESKKIKIIYRRIKRDKLSVRETEKLVKSLSSSKKVLNIPISKTLKSKMSKYENSLVDYLGSKVIINKSKNKKFINIHFSNDEDLERIIELILNEK
ncbi:ParB/RepB/Spo0J family partition protein [bacterium]|nr:MAG: ParB/RepB/Spo0J family partition protein [bacterium]